MMKLIGMFRGKREFTFLQKRNMIELSPDFVASTTRALNSANVPCASGVTTY
jgi:hypothetical protein